MNNIRLTYRILRNNRVFKVVKDIILTLYNFLL